MDAQEIVRRFAKAEADRQVVQSTWDIIEQFVVPFRGRFFKDMETENSVEWRTREVFDSTAIMAAQTLASSLHGSLTSPSYRWFDIRFRADELNEDTEAKAWLEECTKRVYWAIQESNFNLEAPEMYTDIVSFGTSVVVEEFDEDEGFEVVFTAVPVKECFFDEDHRGRVHRFYRKMEWTPTQIVTKFGLDTVPEHVKVCYENNSQEKLEVIYCVYKNESYREQEDVSGPLADEVRPYQYRYVLRKGAEFLGAGGGFYEMPAFVIRWRKTSGSRWGNSPAMIALADVLTLNQLVELILNQAEKVVDPATLVTERGLLSDLDLSPGGMTVVRSLDEIQSYESKARFDVSELQRDKLRSAIRQAFYVDQLELKESPAMTATEVQVRYELMQRLLGPSLGRMETDFHAPMIERTFNGMMRAGRLPEMPESLANNPNVDLDIGFTGPLSRSQKMDAVSATERWLSQVKAVAEFTGPDVLDYIDEEAIIKDQADALNVPAKYIKSNSKVLAVRQQRQQQQAQQQQLMQAQAAGEAMQAMGKGMKEVGAENMNPQAVQAVMGGQNA